MSDDNKDKARFDASKVYNEIYVLQSDPVTTFEQMDKLLRQYAAMIAEGTFKLDLPLAPSVLKLFGPEGPVGELARGFAQTIEADKLDKTSGAMWIMCLCVLGQEFFYLESKANMEHLKEAGLSYPTPEWVQANRYRLSMFAVVTRFKQLACPCPGCLGFWAAKHIKTKADAFLPAMARDLEKLNESGINLDEPGCVRHIVRQFEENDWAMRLDDGAVEGDL